MRKDDYSGIITVYLVCSCDYIVSKRRERISLEFNSCRWNDLVRLYEKERNIIMEEISQEKHVAFLCDLKDECNKLDGCRLNGGDCYMTCNPKHAVNFVDNGSGWYIEIGCFRTEVAPVVETKIE